MEFTFFGLMIGAVAVARIHARRHPYESQIKNLGDIARSQPDDVKLKIVNEIGNIATSAKYNSVKTSAIEKISEIVKTDNSPEVVFQGNKVIGLIGQSQTTIPSRLITGAKLLMSGLFKRRV